MKVNSYSRSEVQILIDEELKQGHNFNIPKDWVDGYEAGLRYALNKLCARRVRKEVE